MPSVKNVYTAKHCEQFKQGLIFPSQIVAFEGFLEAPICKYTAFTKGEAKQREAIKKILSTYSSCDPSYLSWGPLGGLDSQPKKCVKVFSLNLLNLQV